VPDAADLVARAVTAAERGFTRHADALLRHAVHEGTRPIDLILAALAAPPQTVTLPTRESQPMKVTYTGPSTEGVKVVHPDPSSPDANTVTVCAPGEPVDLPDDIARSLVDAGVFDPSEPRRRGGAKQTSEES
jgi:hypothetical protein